MRRPTIAVVLFLLANVAVASAAEPGTRPAALIRATEDTATLFAKKAKKGLDSRCLPW